MRLLFLLLILNLPHAFSQNRIDIGVVKADSSTGFRNGKNYQENAIHLKPIGKSKNEIEIRFTYLGLPGPNWGLSVLTYNKRVWEARRYLYEVLKNDHSSSAIKMHLLKPRHGFDSFFLRLKINHLFTLPNQDELTQGGVLVMDGAHYALKFKAYNRFGQYYFNNPEIYLSNYRDSAYKKNMHIDNPVKFGEELETFNNYANIVSCFYEDLENK